MARNKKEEKELEKKEAEKAPEAKEPELQAGGNEEAGEEPEKKEAEKAPEAKAAKKAAVVSEENEHADALLKLYPQYAELYIDGKGGVFAPSTPAHIRGNARLYKNKYHK